MHCVLALLLQMGPPGPGRGPLMAAEYRPWEGTPHLLGAVIWGLLLLFASSRFRSGESTLEQRTFIWGFAAGLAHSLIPLVVSPALLPMQGWAHPGGPISLLVGSLGFLSMILIVAGFLQSLPVRSVEVERFRRFALPPMAAACAAAMMMTAPLGRPPAPGAMADAKILVVSCGALLLFIGGALTLRYIPAAHSAFIILGIAAFLYGAVIQVVGMPGPPAEGASRPGRRPPPFVVAYSSTAETLAAILLGSLFVRRQSAEMRSEFSTLEDRVRERTAELEAALERLSVANSKLIEQSTVDSLTGVNNRRYFDEALQRQWGAAARERQSLAMALVDLDHFKQINDRYGHQQGDECLVRVATALQSGARRPSDVLARYGGDEFVLLLPGTTLEGARASLERVRVEIEGLSAPGGCPLTVSVGVAACRPAPGGNPLTLLLSADEGLYAAKQAGRNRVVAAAMAEA